MDHLHHVIVDRSSGPRRHCVVAEDSLIRGTRTRSRYHQRKEVMSLTSCQRKEVVNIAAVAALFISRGRVDDRPLSADIVLENMCWKMYPTYCVAKRSFWTGFMFEARSFKTKHDFFEQERAKSFFKQTL